MLKCLNESCHEKKELDTALHFPSHDDKIDKLKKKNKNLSVNCLLSVYNFTIIIQL